MTDTPASRSVLIVDDNDMIRDLCHAALSMEGYITFSAGSGDEALALLEVPDLAVLVTDLNMPGDVDGRALIAVARRVRPEVAIVVASGLPVTEHGLGPIAGLLHKPFGMSQQVSTVQAALKTPA